MNFKDYCQMPANEFDPYWYQSQIENEAAASKYQLLCKKYAILENYTKNMLNNANSEKLFNVDEYINFELENEMLKKQLETKKEENETLITKLKEQEQGHVNEKEILESKNENLQTLIKELMAKYNDLENKYYSLVQTKTEVTNMIETFLAKDQDDEVVQPPPFSVQSSTSSSDSSDTSSTSSSSSPE